MTLLKWLKHLLGASFLSFSLACVLGYFLLCTALGLETVVYLVEQFMPGQLSIGEVQGSLISACKFKSVRYQSAFARFFSQEINLRVHVDKHQLHKVVIDSLTLLNTEVDVVGDAKTTSSLVDIKPLLNFSHYVVLDHLQILHCKVRKSASEVIRVELLNMAKSGEDEHVFTLTSSLMNTQGRIKLQVLPILNWQIVTHVNRFDPSMYWSSLNGELNFELTSDGAWEDNNKYAEIYINKISGNLNHASVMGEVNVSIEKNTARIKKLFLRIGDALLTAKGSLNRHSQITWSLNIPNCAHLLRAASGQINLNGIASGHLNDLHLNADLSVTQFKYAQINIAKLTGKILAKIRQDVQLSLNLWLKKATIYNVVVDQSKAFLLLSYINHKISSSLMVDLTHGNRMNAQIVLPQIDRFDVHQTVISRMSIDLKTLHPYLQLPHVSYQQASLNCLFNVAGKIDDLHVNGSGSFLLVQAKFDELGATISKLKLSAKNSANQIMTIDGNLYAGVGGSARIHSIFDWSNALKLSISLVGNKLPVLNLAKYKIQASPNMHFIWHDNLLSMSGQLNLPVVQIRMQKIKNLVDLPSEVVIVNQKTSMFVLPQISGKVLLNLGDKVDIIYDNLTANLAGQLEIEQGRGGAPVGIGQITVKKGQYAVYGKKLAIKQGKFIYAGNLITDPGLDLQATQKIKTINMTPDQHVILHGAEDSKIYSGNENVVVGVLVRGTLNDPQVSLTSDPAMSQDNILSYLIFGHPRSQITEASSLALINALTTSQATGKKILANVDLFKQQLGLNELSVDNTNYYSAASNSTVSATTINVKKKIGKKLSINYSQGIFSPVSLFGIRYQINKYFTLQSQSSPIDNGIDILYEYEHG